MTILEPCTEFIRLKKQLNRSSKSVRRAHESRETTKDALKSAKSNIYKRKASHPNREKRQENYQIAIIKNENANANFYKATGAYSSQLRDFEQFAIKLAEVPVIFRDNVSVVISQNGETEIYFGGKKYPLGFGHGHYTIDKRGRVTKWREQGVLHTRMKKNAKVFPFTRCSDDTIEPNWDTLSYVI